MQNKSSFFSETKGRGPKKRPFSWPFLLYKVKFYPSGYDFTQALFLVVGNLHILNIQTLILGCKVAIFCKEIQTMQAILISNRAVKKLVS